MVSKNVKNLFIGLAIIALVLFGLPMIAPSSIVNSAGIPLLVNSVTAVNQNGSPVTLVSNDAQLASTRFLVDTTIGLGGNQSIQTSNLQSQDPLANTQLTKNVNIKATSIYEYVSYSVYNEAVPIYRYYTFQTYDLFGSCPTFSSLNPVNNPPLVATFVIGKPFPSTGKICVYKAQVANKAQLNTGIPVEIVTVSVSGDAGSSTATIGSPSASSNGYSQSATLGTLGSVVWSGALPTSNLVPNAAQYVLAYKKSNSTSWKLAKVSDYTQIAGAVIPLDNQLSALQANGFTSSITFTPLNSIVGFSVPNCTGSSCAAQVDSYLAGYNTVADRITNANESIPYPNAATIQSGDKFNLQLNGTQFFNPKLQFYLNSSTLGIVIKTSKPKIVSFSPNPLTFPIGSTTAQTVAVNVQNIGGGSGSFLFSLSNCSNLILSGSPSTGTIPAGASTTALLTLLPNGSSTPSTNSCSITVYDPNDTTGTMRDSANLSVVLQASQICTPNQFSVLTPNSYAQCNSTGSAYLATVNCSNGVSATGGNVSCQPESGPPVVPSGQPTSNAGACTDAQIAAGNHTVVTNTPQYLLFVIPTGTASQTTCVSNIDINVILAAVIIAAAVFGGFLTFRKPKRGK